MPSGQKRHGGPFGALRRKRDLRTASLHGVPRATPRRLPPEGNDWEIRRLKAELCTIPWIERTYPLAGRTVFEYGCGNGAVSCAIAPFVDRLIGLDINSDDVEFGIRRARELGLTNVELVYAPLERIVDETAGLQGGVDVFLLYAVLEHMTVAERLEILELARRVVRADGVIVVSELPNRLIPYDGHTSQMAFFAQLPDEVALRYYGRSNREDFVTSMDAAVSAGPEHARDALVRWGRGVSFHEFELVFGDLARHVLSSNYDELLMPIREITREELMLSGLLDEYRPDLAPLWSRYWQDLVMSPEPRFSPPPPFIRPWLMRSGPGTGVVGSTATGLELSAGRELPVRLPVPTARVLVGVSVGVENVTITVDAGRGPVSVTEAKWRSLTASRYAEIDLGTSSADLELRVDAPGVLTFFGYEA